MAVDSSIRDLTWSEGTVCLQRWMYVHFQNQKNPDRISDSKSGPTFGALSGIDPSVDYSLGNFNAKIRLAGLGSRVLSNCCDENEKENERITNESTIGDRNLIFLYMRYLWLHYIVALSFMRDLASLFVVCFAFYS